MTSVNVTQPPTEQQGFAVFPREISQFFTGDSGRTLLIKGAPGTGKTLFTIRGLDVLERDGDVHYVTTRVDRETVHEMYFDEYPSLDKTQILDLSQNPFDLPLDVEVPFEKLDLDSVLEWIETIGDVSKRPTIAFDSWELIYEYLAARQDNLPDIETVTNQLVALARDADIRLMLVSEAANAPSLEYVVDGVVALLVNEDERGRTRRHLRLEKLRSVRIGNRLHPITLADGQFRAITPVELPSVRSETADGSWEPLPDSKAKFSTGIRDLDPILSGGYNRGSVVHLELGTDLSRDAWSVLTLPTIRNFLSNTMGVAVVPPREGSPGLLHNDLHTVVSPDIFDTYCHIFETYAGPSQSEDRNAVPESPTETESDPSPSKQPSSSNTADTATTETGSSSKERNPSNTDEASRSSSTIHGGSESPVEGGQLNYDPYMDYIERVRKQSDGPLLHVISMDTAQAAFEPRLGDFANYVALHNDLAILITKPGTDLRKRADRVADMHFRLERSGKAIILYGENPLTPLLGIGLDNSQSIPKITLTEMV